MVTFRFRKLEPAPPVAEPPTVEEVWQRYALNPEKPRNLSICWTSATPMVSFYPYWFRYDSKAMFSKWYLKIDIYPSTPPTWTFWCQPRSCYCFLSLTVHSFTYMITLASTCLPEKTYLARLLKKPHRQWQWSYWWFLPHHQPDDHLKKTIHSDDGDFVARDNES